MQSMDEVIAEMKANTVRAENARRFVADWRSMIPAWSLWRPGCIGKPDCMLCKGLGYVGEDLPVGHPYFGRLHHCRCTGKSSASERDW